MAVTARRLHVAEPEAAYSDRPRLVVDATVIAAAVFGEAGRAEAIALLHGRALHAPHLLDYEIASVGLKKLRREAVASELVAGAMRAYARLALERHAIDAEQVVAIAQRYTLTAYDAAYLCLAEQITAPLATFDETLGAAARVHLTADR